MVNGVKHLIECINQNKTPVATGKDAIESLALICAFHESAMQDGKKIMFPFETSEVNIKAR